MKKVIAYLQGNIRLSLYFSDIKFFRKLLPLHIVEQFEYRLKSIPDECYNSGQCRSCSCSVPALQMANKSCDEKCYPKMMSKSNWEKFKKTKEYFIKTNYVERA